MVGRFALVSVLMGILGIPIPGLVAAGETGLSLWAVDALVKVFPDTSASPTAMVVVLRGAANEFLSGQVAVRAGRDVKGVSVRWERSLRHEERDYTIPAGAARARFVGFIPIARNTPNTPEGRLVRKAPCEIPDPLLETEKVDLAAGRAQPIWLTVHVPANAPPGEYRGRLAVGNEDVAQSIEVMLEVYPFILPNDRHLWVTNWFDPGRIARFHNVDPGSEQYWSILERYGRNMAEHRQNVVLTRPSLVKVFREGDGRLSFDYADLDRWVEMFMKAGACERIEIGHVAHHGKGGWGSSEFVLNTISATDRATGKRVSLPPEKGLSPLLADLERHLAERGWLDRAMIHVGDEPAVHNLESWRKASEFIRRAAPRIPRIEAIESRDFAGALEIWVPKLNYLTGWLDAYRTAQGDGGELWFYTCLHPQGYYPNRLLDYPLVGTRIMHWLNWRYRLDGYLHWGWNFWTDDPFTKPHDRLPPGDNNIVYPGKDGPLDSIRWEMMRAGIQDYELFHLLTEKTRRVAERLGEAAESIDPRQRSDEICGRIVESFSDYERDPAAFREVRRMLLEEIAAIDTPPLALVATAPPAGSELIPGPIVVEIDGVVEKGAAVKTAGGAVNVKPDGRFLARTSLSPRRYTIEITIEHNGRTKTLRRRFRVRPLQ